jgi:hypothetical protein
MGRRARIALVAALVAVPAAAQAAGIRSPIPVAVRARLDVRVLASEASGEWTVTTRSPADESRFMADLTAGNAKTGILYVKGASSWRDSDDALGRVHFIAEQGDYTHGLTWADSARADLVLFGDERRFFTHEIGTAVVEDDEADDFEHRIGARADARMDALRATYWIAGLDTGDERRTNQYAALRFAPAPAFVGVSYLHDAADAGDNHAVAKAEAATYFRGLTAILSYEASGTGSGAAFPSGTWDDFDDGYADAAPANSASFVEVRARRTRVGEDHLFDASYRYGAVGDDYTNDLNTLVPGSVTQRAWVDWAHRRYALDARLSAHRVEQTFAETSVRRGVDVTARARLTDNSEWLVRGGAARDETIDGDEDFGFGHAAYSRELSEFSGGLHAMVDDIGVDAVFSAGAEVRLNWSATGAVTGRWIIVDQAGGSDAFWVRMELRPTRRTWVTLGYGRESRGDDVYFLEDRDAPPSIDTGNAITISVRGDL